MNVSDFINCTLTMPGLRDVFLHNKKEDFIFLRCDLVRSIGIHNLTWAMGRLSEILRPQGVNIYLENLGVYGYKIVAKEFEGYGKCVAASTAVTES